MNHTDIKLTFVPEDISRLAGLISAERTKIEQALGDIGKNSGALLNIWKGTSADLYKDKAETTKTSGETILKILLEYINDLQDVSGIYKASENASIAENEKLPINGVFLV